MRLSLLPLSVLLVGLSRRDVVSGSGAAVTSGSRKYLVVTSVKVVLSIEGKSRGMLQ